MAVLKIAGMWAITSILMSAQTIQFADVRWASRSLYEGSNVLVESIEGVLTNSSEQDFYFLTLVASVYAEDATLLADSIPAVAQYVPAHGRWAFSMSLISTMQFSAPLRPAYAKITRASCIVGTTRLELPVPYELTIWSPESVARLAYGMEVAAKAREKQMASAMRDFQKKNHCPSTKKASGKCKGFYIDFVTPLESGGLNAASNMVWKEYGGAKSGSPSK